MKDNQKQSGVAAPAVIAVIALLIIAGAVVFFASRPNKSDLDNGQAMMEDDKMDKNGDAMMENEGGTMMEENNDEGMESGEMMMEKEGAYKDYSPELVKTEQVGGQKVVLFFHATWCPFCQAADADFRAHTDKIPAGVTVLKTDYDTEKELKQKYAVTYQHTFVQIDSEGNQVTKWISGDTELLAKNVQ